MVNQTNLLQPNLPTQQIQAQAGGVVGQPYQPVISAYAAQPVLDPRVMLQPGFSNTNVGHVRLSNQSSQAQAGGYFGPQAFVPQQQPVLQHVPQVVGPQSPSAMLQPGFAGTSVDQVIQNNQISQAHAGGYLGPQAFVPQQQTPSVMFQPGYAGTGIGQLSQGYAQQTPSAVFQPGFAGTNLDHVIQSNQRSQAQAGGYFGPQAFVPQQQIGQQVGFGPQQMLQPGFAGTSVDQVIQSNQRSQAQAGGYYGPQAIAQQQPQQQIPSYVPQSQQPIYQPIGR